MVGDIPYVEYEWNYTNVDSQEQYYNRFPSDLYYMNVSGVNV